MVLLVEMQSCFRKSCISLEVKFVPWSVRISCGIQTLKNTWTKAQRIAGAAMVWRGRAPGNWVA